MKFNKRAIMVEFLVTVILALIIFTPTCLFASKLFRQSDQARDSFFDLTKELRQLADKGTSDDKKSVLLIMDENTGIIFYNLPEQQWAFSKYYAIGQSERLGDTPQILVEQNYFLNYPANNCRGLPCSCLCREFSKEPTRKDSRKAPLKDFSLIPGITSVHKIIIQRNWDQEMRIEDYNIDCRQPQCQHLPSVKLEQPLSLYRFPSENRRTIIIVEKKGDKISLTEQ